MRVRNENATLAAGKQSQQMLLDERNAAGHWVGELSASALSTATAISAYSFYLEQGDVERERETVINQQIQCGANWLVSLQNDDGGWGDTTKNCSNISTTMLVVAALHASNHAEKHVDVVSTAETYLKKHGGVEGVRKRYGEDKTFAVPILANCAMAGIVDWSEVGTLPFEAACVPQRFYHLLNLPVVSYAVPALVAIGQAKFHFDPPRNLVMRWVRKLSVKRSLNVLEKMQPASGGYLEAIPLTSFVCMALSKCGQHEHPIVNNGIRFLMESFRECEGCENEKGTWPIDTNLSMWVTTLSINALAKDSTFDFDATNKLHETLNWILSCQYNTRHPFTGSAPGGWGWSDLTGSVPDADDTPGAMLALKALHDRLSLQEIEKVKIANAAMAGIDWLLGLQNRDGGWPTFCRGWGRLPFDRSGNDITAHVIRALHTWRTESRKAKRIDRAIAKGFRFLRKNQNSDGSWLPLWFGNQDQGDDINPFYGTAKVLHAYYDSDSFDTKFAQNGLEWLRNNQNSDGGWGGGPSVNWRCSELDNSSVEETALCTEVLLLDECPASRQMAERGLQWLIRAVDSDSVATSTPIGFYFAKLWYFEKLYPLIFATSTLGTANSQKSL